MAAGRNRTPKRAAKPPVWEAAFLSALRDSGNVRVACAAAQVGKSTAYDRRKVSPEFGAAWSDAMDDAADVLEAEARRRAVVGGSDTLLIFLLKGARPEKYRDHHRVDLGGKVGVSLDTEYVRIRSAIADALHAFPDARKAVAERLVALDERAAD